MLTAAENSDLYPNPFGKPQCGKCCIIYTFIVSVVHSSANRLMFNLYSESNQLLYMENCWEGDASIVIALSIVFSIVLYA